MKVTVTVSIEVDPQAWDQAYGTGTRPADVRADVRTYIVHALSNLPPVDEGGIRSITEKSRQS